MTRIYSLSFESGGPVNGRFLMVLVAHKAMRQALRIAATEAGKQGGKWRLVHKAVKRSGLAIPMGEVLGVSGPYDWAVEED
jgi:hypothetical protein